LLGAMVAPTPVSALLHSATMVNLGVYLMLRLTPQLSASQYLLWGVALVGLVSFVAATMLAITQSNAKRVLAYSTIGNLGLIFVCIGIGTPLSITAAIVLLIFHAISKALLFLCVGVFKDEQGNEDIESMHGLRDRMPFVALAFLFGAFFLALPPFGLLAGKWMTAEAGTTMPLVGLLLALGIAAPAVYLGKWAGQIFAADRRVERAEASKEKLPRLYRYTLASLVGGGLLLSFLIGFLVEGLVNPFVRRTFHLVAVDNSAFNLVTSLGAFPYLAFLIIFALLFVGLAALTRPEEKELSDPYTCGEEPEFEIAGQYYVPETQVLRATKYINALATLVLATMIVIPVLLEAKVW
ncbi:MAG: proton-conducting transporter membrane subunit, partial [Methanomassiliicoccales archaeon]